MADVVVLKMVGTEYEAEMICSLLRTVDVICAHRPTDIGVGAAGGMPRGGPREVLVRRNDLATAVDVIANRM
jgi:hypothetical protein